VQITVKSPQKRGAVNVPFIGLAHAFVASGLYWNKLNGMNEKLYFV